MKITKRKTNRGFARREFVDFYDKKCSVTKSSLATADAIWIGIDDPEPKVMAREAASVGVKTSETTGWVPYPVPKEVLLHTHMHLTRAQVKKLLPMLQKFVETGEL